MKIIAIINAYELPASLSQAKRYKQEMEQQGVQLDIVHNGCFLSSIEDGKINIDLAGYDACMYLDKDMYTAKMISAKFIRMFNNVKAIEICDDKMLTHIALADCNIPMPKTISGLLCYNSQLAIRQDFVQRLERELGYPMVAKHSQGSWGEQVFLIENSTQLQEKYKQMQTTKHLFQQFVQSSSGKDIRVIVVGGKVIASMLRTSNGDFRSNIELGGSAKAIDLPPSFAQTAIKCAKVLELDYCGVDLLIDSNGQPLVCEVNSNAFFEGIEKVCNVNVARHYCKYIIDTLKAEKSKL